MEESRELGGHKGMHTLVTGGAGFIGSHLCESLLQRGGTVTVIDNLCDYYDPRLKEMNLKAIKETGPGRFQLVRGDIRNSSDLRRAFSSSDIDMVVHLAAMAGVRPSILQPIYYHEVNVLGTVNLLDMMEEFGVRKMVFASSSSVYGDTSEAPFREDARVDSPISPYAATKRAGELSCYTYHHLYGIDTACLRFFTVYGPRQRPDLAIRHFANCMMNSKVIQLYGDGSTRRDYTYVDDTIHGILRAIEWVEDGDSDRYDIFNLGESQTVSLKEMVDALAEAIGVDPKIEYKPMQPGDVKQTYADISKARRVLGYDPRVDFGEGIRRFAEWYTSL